MPIVEKKRSFVIDKASLEGEMRYDFRSQHP